MDPRTRMILYKLVRNGMLQGVHGCISTGKEANVYYAEDSTGKGVAIKVYRTSVLVFKDRERYVEGDFRFQRYCKSNPRKMVRVWAEKESRNLRRLETAGIPAPRVQQLRHHVLLMNFLGNDGWPWPRLQEANVVRSHGPALYTSAIELLRDMYQKCNLIHGDFSEYNILVDVPKGGEVETDDFVPTLYVIDVSQSVEPDHPNSTIFLRRDIVNTNRFFEDYVEPSLRATVEDTYAYVTGRSSVLVRDRTEETDALRDAVFGQIPIPKELGNYTVPHVSADVERQFEVLKSTDIPTDDAKSARTNTWGLAPQGGCEEDSSKEEEEEEEEGEGEGEDGPSGGGDRRVVIPITKEEKKAHRAAVKEANRERRKTKVPKHLKKKKCGKK